MGHIHDVARSGDVDAMRKLLRKGISIVDVDDNGHSPLHLSALSGNVACTELLLLSGANPRSVDSQGYTPLHFAAITDADQCESLIRHLHLAGADLEARVHRGGHIRDWTPLMLAVCEGSASAVRALICQGADVNARDSESVTPIMIAAQQCRESEEKINVLLAAGANKYITSQEGFTAQDYAIQHLQFVVEGQHDSHARKVIDSIHEQAYSQLEASGFSMEVVHLPDVNTGVNDIIRDWHRVVSLLSVE